MIRRGRQVITYDEAYAEWPAYYGDKVSGIVKEYLPLAAKSRPILDIGAGQGRCAFYLAEQGYRVDALDISEAGLSQINAVATKKNLPITTHQADFENFSPDNAPYGGILALGLIQIIPWGKIEKLIHRINDWSAAGSIVFVSTFTTRDPRWISLVGSRATGKWSFNPEEGYHRTFLDPDEILKFFAGYEVIYHNELMGDIHNHGDGLIHRHCVSHNVFRKPQDRLDIIDFSPNKDA